MFRSSISFWSDPKADGVTYLITSAFGLLIVSLARYQNYQETDLSELITAALPMLIVVVIGLGICVVFDRGLRESNNPVAMVVNATTTVLVCNLISCFFVWVMGFILYFNLTVANLLGFAVISRNTAAKRSDHDFNWSRIVIWGFVLFVFTRISLGILVSEIAIKPNPVG
jgi:hypothetical protein